MTDKQEIRKFKMIMNAGILFLFSAYFSWQELNYLLFAETAEGMITSSEIVTVTGRRGRQYENLLIKYNFDDGDKNIWREVHKSVDWEVPQDRKVEIQYHSGKPSSARLKGSEQIWPVIVFFAAIGWLIFELVKLSRELKDADWM